MRFDFASQNINDEEFLKKLWQNFTGMHALILDLMDLSIRRPPNVNRFLCNAVSIFVMHIVDDIDSLNKVIS